MIPRFVPSRLLPGARIRPYGAEDVTTVHHGEVPPESVGLAPDAVEKIWAAVTRYYGTRLHPALALCIRRRGQIVLDRAIGHARGNHPGAAEDDRVYRATPDTPFLLYSASKVVTVMLIHHLHTEGALSVDDHVSSHIPGFGRHGKGRITIGHILAHTAGIPAVPGGMIELDDLHDRDGIVEVLCDLRPVSSPGDVLAYHAVTGGFVLGEVIERVTGMSPRDYLTQVVREPLGMSMFSFGVAPEHVEAVAQEAFTGPRVPFALTAHVARALGTSARDAVDIANDPRFLTAVVPSGNIIGTAREIGRFFELLLRGGELDGVRVFASESIDRAKEQQSIHRLDRTILLPIRYGSGFMLGADQLSFFGAHTAQAFGHLGFARVLAWADPERDISVAFLNSGNPILTPEMFLWVGIMRRIARLVPRDAAC